MKIFTSSSPSGKCSVHGCILILMKDEQSLWCREDGVGCKYVIGLSTSYSKGNEAEVLASMSNEIVGTTLVNSL
jgi:hypothetical protein